MKKIFLFLVMILCANVNAQTEFGVKGGYTLSNMKWQVKGFDDYSFQSKSSFYIGVLAERHLSEKISLQGELLYTELGGKDAEILTALVGNEVVEMGTNTTTFKTSQIQVPISAKYYVAPNISFLAGMTFGFNVSSTVKNTFVSEQTPNGKTDLFTTVNLFPFLGTELKLNDHFFTELRYNFNVFNSAINDAPKTKINFLQVGLGYRFK